MKLIYTALLFGFLIGVLSGCASTFERTESLLNEGRAEEALTFLEQKRGRDPLDAELIGLERRARLQWISDKLIQVRLSRLADNRGASIDLMRKILKNESDWGLIPTGAVYATHAEEVAHLSAFIQSGIYESIQKNQPLLALAKYRSDRVLLEELLRLETKTLMEVIHRSGKIFCDSESKRLSQKDHYTYGFLMAACKELRAPFAKQKTENSVKLFGKLQPEIEIRNIADPRVAEFSSQLRGEFEKSIWHDPASGNSLSIKIAGTVDEKIEEQNAWRSKPYTVQVPYEEASVRKKTDKTGIETLFAIMAWALTTSTPDREVDNRDGTVTVYETKYRSETRHHLYTAKQVTQTLEADWQVALNPDVKSHEFQFRDRLETVSDEHGVRFPEASLQPETRKLVLPADWVMSLNRKLMDRIALEFNQAWIQRFCSSATSSISKTEVQHRCIFGANGQTPVATAEWFKARYGIEIETWRQLLTVSK